MTLLWEYRQTFARRVGVFWARTATGGSTTTLLDQTYPIQSTNAQDDLYAGKWILRPDAADADKVRVVSDTGYAPTTGALSPDSAWQVAPTAGERYEIHGAVEPWTTVNDLVNAALKRCWLVVEVAVVPVVGATRHGLATVAPWLRDPRHVRQAGWLYATEDRAAADPFRRHIRGAVERDGDALYLNHPTTSFQAGDTLYLRCIKRAYDHCRSSATGAYGERAGLASDAHGAPADQDWVVAAMRVEHWGRFAEVVASGDRAQADKNKAEAAAEFDTLTAEWFVLPPSTLVPLPRATGLRGWRW